MKPLATAALLFLPAVGAAFLPSETLSLLLYERTALFHGQFWRLWTSHWIHFSPSHLTWNLLVVLVAGTWLEKLHPGRLPRFALFAAPVIGLTLLGFAPAMHTYGGLSGLAVGLVTTLALTQSLRQGPGQMLWTLCLVAIAGKLAFELLVTPFGFARFAPGIQASPLAHVAGAAAGVIYSLSAAAWALHPRTKLTRNHPHVSALSWSPNATTRSS